MVISREWTWQERMMVIGELAILAHRELVSTGMVEVVAHYLEWIRRLTFFTAENLNANRSEVLQDTYFK